MLTNDHHIYLRFGINGQGSLYGGVWASKNLVWIQCPQLHAVWVTLKVHTYRNGQFWKETLYGYLITFVFGFILVNLSEAYYSQPLAVTAQRWHKELFREIVSLKRVWSKLDNGLVGPAGLPVLFALQVFDIHKQADVISCTQLDFNPSYSSVSWATGTTGGHMMESQDQVALQQWKLSSNPYEGKG